MLALRFPRAPCFFARAVVALLRLGAATACSRGSDLPVAVPGPVPGLLSVGLASFPASVVAGGQATVGITVARSGSFTGPVTLAVEGAPSGVTASLSATVLAAEITSATLTVQVGATVAAGSYPLTVRASGAGVPDRTAVIALVVTAPPPVPTLALASSTGTVSVVQNTSSAAITLTLTRGGGLTGGATMALDGAPPGVSGVFTPNPATDATTALVLNATTAAAPGSYPLTVRATIGSTSATTAIALTVQPAPPPMPAVWQFCADGRPPIWFAYRDGIASPWTRVLPDANNRFAFTLSDTRASVTLVRDADGGFDVTAFDVFTFHQSRAELIALGPRQCQETPGSRTLTGSVAGLGLGQAAAIVAGGATGGAGLNGIPYTVRRNVRNGPLDLLAARTGVTLATLATDPDRLILRRNLTPPAGGAVPLLDFASAESFAPATATYTIANVLGARMALTTSFVTANGTVGSFIFGPQLVGAGGAHRVRCPAVAHAARRSACGAGGCRVGHGHRAAGHQLSPRVEQPVVHPRAAARRAHRHHARHGAVSARARRRRLAERLRPERGRGVRTGLGRRALVERVRVPGLCRGHQLRARSARPRRH